MFQLKATKRWTPVVLQGTWGEGTTQPTWEPTMNMLLMDQIRDSYFMKLVTIEKTDALSIKIIL